MPEVITLSKRGGIAVITINNPPVNGLSAAVCTGLVEQITAGLKDPEVQAFVIIGADRMFSSGADIREFGESAPPGVSSLRSAVEALEASPKPVVAAIHGVAAGGGLEVALGCHVRLAAPGTRVGLPEVTLGLVPGAGGTQRLPRLIGALPALEVIVSGTLLPIAKAYALGIVDEVVDGDLVDAAVTVAQRAVAEGRPPRKTSEMEDKIKEARGKPEIFEEFRKKMARRARGFEAPYACVACVEAAVSLPFSEGLATERETFTQLVSSDQSRAQRHVFFAEREVAKVPDVPSKTPTKRIDRVAVIGCGTMGGGIAMSFANAGMPVRVLEVSREAVDKGMHTIRTSYASTVSKGNLSQADMDERMRLITTTLDYDDLGEADLVIEAVFEEMDLKKQVMVTLDQVCKQDAILTTNTSTLDVDAIASATARPDRVMGTHFFSPAHVMRLMENVRGAKTSKQTIATVMKLAKTLGKVGALVDVCDGFVGNRMLFAYTRQANFLLEEGALPQQVDKALYDFGLPMGPFAMDDLAGLDVGWRIRMSQAATRPKHLRYSPIADRLCERGRFGQKTSAGWYRYEPGSRTPIPDPDVEDLITSMSAERGIKRRDIGDGEILRRCLYPLVNEGAKILDEGVALRAGDIDIIWIYGYGFPRYRGGPMFWADTVGLRPINDALHGFYDVHGEWLRPAPLLERLAKEGKGFKDLEARG